MAFQCRYKSLYSSQPPQPCTQWSPSAGISLCTPRYHRNPATYGLPVHVEASVLLATIATLQPIVSQCTLKSLYSSQQPQPCNQWSPSAGISLCTPGNNRNHATNGLPVQLYVTVLLATTAALQPMVSQCRYKSLYSSQPPQPCNQWPSSAGISHCTPRNHRSPPTNGLPVQV